MNETPGWTPPPSEDMRDGLSFGSVVLFVGGGIMLLALLAYFVIPWRKVSLPKIEVAKVAESPKQQVEQPEEKTVQAEPTAMYDTSVPANLPPTRGFLVFRGKIALIDKVDARISPDRKKIILLLNPKSAGETGNIPALGVVLAFKHASDSCDKDDLDKFQLRIDMQSFKVGGERVTIIDRNPASKYLYQVNELSCDRGTGGKIDLHMVGSENILNNENISWSFATATRLQ